jgi:quinol monooxygenase YgiN
MVVSSIHYTFSVEDADKAASIFVELRDASRREKGVISFEVGRGQEDPNVFALWEEYRDEAAREAHLASDHFTRLVVKGVRPLAKKRDFVAVVPL